MSRPTLQSALIVLLLCGGLSASDVAWAKKNPQKVLEHKIQAAEEKGDTALAEELQTQLEEVIDLEIEGASLAVQCPDCEKTKEMAPPPLSSSDPLVRIISFDHTEKLSIHDPEHKAYIQTFIQRPDGSKLQNNQVRFDALKSGQFFLNGQLMIYNSGTGALKNCTESLKADPRDPACAPTALKELSQLPLQNQNHEAWNVVNAVMKMQQISELPIKDGMLPADPKERTKLAIAANENGNFQALLEGYTELQKILESESRFNAIGDPYLKAEVIPDTLARMAEAFSHVYELYPDYVKSVQSLAAINGRFKNARDTENALLITGTLRMVFAQDKDLLTGEMPMTLASSLNRRTGQKTWGSQIAEAIQNGDILNYNRLKEQIESQSQIKSGQ